MKDIDRDRWLSLCAQAAVEQDPEKLIKLVVEINSLLTKSNGDWIKRGHTYPTTNLPVSVLHKLREWAMQPSAWLIKAC